MDVNFVDSIIADDIDETVDYSKVAELATKLAISKKYKLIESLCSDLNNLFLNTFNRIKKTKIIVKKPNALPKAKYAAYTMEKSRT